MINKFDNTERDKLLLEWLDKNREDITVGRINRELELPGPNKLNYISRRLSQLEDKCILKFSVLKNIRQYRVVRELPESMGQKRWAPGLTIAEPEIPSGPSIKAKDSIEFEAKGGIVQKLPNNWDSVLPSKTLGYSPSDMID